MFAIISRTVNCLLLFLCMGQKSVALPVDKYIPQGHRVLLDASQTRLCCCIFELRDDTGIPKYDMLVISVELQCAEESQCLQPSQHQSVDKQPSFLIKHKEI